MNKVYCNSPEKLQLEISSMCNALCLGCRRIDHSNLNTLNPIIEKGKYVDTELIKKIVSHDHFSKLTNIDFCGSIDDPLMHPKLFEILEIIRTHLPNVGITIHTNASLRTTEYWKKLALILKNFYFHSVHFSIDGLKDTNHIYRQKTNFDKIIENASAFISAGGYAVWQYIIFPWNKHQVEEAKELSQKLGFSEFHQRHDRSVNKTLKEIQNIKKQNLSKQQDPLNYSFIKELDKKINDNIECHSKNKKQYFLSYTGNLWPCCFLADGQPANVDNFLKQRFSHYDKNWNNCYENTIDKIISHQFFQNELHDSWQSNNHGTGCNDRIFPCTRVCSKKTLIKNPVSNPKIETL